MGVVCWLLKKGINLNLDVDGMLVLVMVVLEGYENMVVVLFEWKVSVKWRDLKSGNIVFMYVVFCGYVGCVGLLFVVGVDLSVKNK